MGWKWEDDDEPSNSRGFGEIVNPNPNPKRTTEDGCSTRRIVKSRCRTEEVEPGRFVRKCENTEQILREFIGRPAEVVESKTEHIEDVTDEVTSGLHRSGSTAAAFTFPGLRSDIENIEQSLFGGLGVFIEAAEEMANGFFQSFNFPSHNSRDLPPYERRFPANPLSESERDDSERMEEESPPYSDIAGEITDV